MQNGKERGNESRVKRAQMRVNRREGYQTMEERCLKKAMSKPNMEKNNWRLEKGGTINVKINLLRFKKELRKRKEKEGKSVLRVE